MDYFLLIYNLFLRLYYEIYVVCQLNMVSQLVICFTVILIQFLSGNHFYVQNKYIFNDNQK